MTIWIVLAQGCRILIYTNWVFFFKFILVMQYHLLINIFIFLSGFFGRNYMEFFCANSGLV